MMALSSFVPFRMSLLALSLLLLLPSTAHAKMHHVDIRSDTRPLITFEVFGFLEGGVLGVNVSSFSVDEKEGASASTGKLGFVLVRESELAAYESKQDNGECMYDLKGAALQWAFPNPPPTITTTTTTTTTADKPKRALADELSLATSVPALAKDVAATSSKNNNHHQISYVVPKGKKGRYHFFFTNCMKPRRPVSFVVDAVLYNPGPVYLSAGESAVPGLLMFFAFVFAGSLVLWVRWLRASPEKVNHVHHMMTVLLMLKVLAMLSFALDQHFIKQTGSAMGWNLAYYVFSSLKGISMFTVILLVGAGWSVLKPTLHQRERRILLFVITAQVIANVALIAEDEMSPGAIGRMRWRDLLHVVDLIACVAVFLPILWQINRLKAMVGNGGAGGGGGGDKVDHNLRKLRQFRKFYFSVVAYIYFTRVVVYLLSSSLPFEYAWVRTLLRESATVCFFAYAGFTFRPGTDTAYSRVRLGDFDDEEMQSVIGSDEQSSEFGLDALN